MRLAALGPDGFSPLLLWFFILFILFFVFLLSEMNIEILQKRLRSIRTKGGQFLGEISSWSATFNLWHKEDTRLEKKLADVFQVLKEKFEDIFVQNYGEITEFDNSRQLAPLGVFFQSDWLNFARIFRSSTNHVAPITNGFYLKINN